MSNRMHDLRYIVVEEMFCLWALFLENVEAEGWTESNLEDAVNECHGDKEMLRRLACQFI